MSIINTMKNRRTIGLMEEKEVPFELINQMLDAATWAPNHKRTEPWKFRVITGNARVKLGEEISNIMSKKLLDIVNREKELKKLKDKPLTAPVIIAVAVSPSGKVPVIEEIAAVSCATQNMLLVAEENNLATIWRTGKAVFQTELNNFLSLEKDDFLLGLIYVGYPKKKIGKGMRTNFQEKTIWIK
ncbi:nitroreductase [Bacillus cereus]|uniref:nitroreductase family protein n=1 Tax=Bacillus cereus group TaxID=86661 RepID=UPI0011C9F9F2|nr:nitroreductase [Bacillus sp. AY18-3]MDA2385616.1 nitroreductase [Bacillus cereus]TXR64449.1 nitroreductase [Bacillus sp. AY18-3]